MYAVLSALHCTQFWCPVCSRVLLNHELAVVIGHRLGWTLYIWLGAFVEKMQEGVWSYLPVFLQMLRDGSARSGEEAGDRFDKLLRVSKREGHVSVRAGPACF